MNYVTDNMRRELANHVLTLTHNGGAIRHYRLGPSDTNMGEARLIFTSAPLPEQVIITGDLNPRENGIVSQQGYGIGWFGRRQGESYLCEKFLRTSFYTEHARAWLRDEAADLADPNQARTDDPAQIAALQAEVRDAIGRGDHGDDPTRSHEAFWDWLRDYGVDPEDEGFGYDPKVAGWLCAIQQRFVELYAATTSEGA